MSNRVLRAIGLGAAALLFLGGCSSTATTQGQEVDPAATPEYSGKITLLTKFGTQPFPEYFQSLADEYKTMHPDVTVELIQESDQSVKDKIKTMTASQSLPDIYFTWTGDWAQNFIKAGLATDLTPVIDPETEWGASFVRANLDAFKTDDKYWAMPFHSSAKFMGYNERIFSEAGVSVPKSFEELLNSCSAIKSAGYVPIAFGNKDGWPALHYIQQLFAFNVPTDILEKDFVPATATWDHPGYVTSLNQFSSLLDECTDGRAATNGVLFTTAQQSLANGKSAMYYQEIPEFDRVTADGAPINEDGFGVFVLPPPKEAEGNTTAIEGAPVGFIVNPKGNVPLAVDFLKFVTKLENAKKLSSPPYGQPSSVLGGVTPDTSSPAVNKGAELLADSGALIGWLDTVTSPDVAAAWLSGTQGLITGDVDANALLERVQAASESSK